MFEISLLSAAISFYALGVSAVLCFRRSKVQFRPVAIVGLVASALVCALAVGNLLGIGPVLRVEYKGESYAFANILITILSLLAVLILERVRREEVMRALKHQALHDPLTDLPNRANFVRTLESALEETARADGKMAVFLLDLDRFKDINDTLGHPVGDRLLQELGTRLIGKMPAQAMLARFGGDEFALLLTGVRDTAEVQLFARTVLEALWQPFWVDEVILDVGGSIGAALFPDHGTTTDGLLQHADIAMYKAKRQHSGFEMYSPEDDPHSLRSLTLTGDLRRAIEANELEIVFQPKINLRNGEITGAEVLTRWRRGEHGLVSPDEFITHAEQCGLIFPMTKWVLNAALERASEWRRAGHDIEIAVNLSARLLHHAAVVPMVVSLLTKWQYPSRRLTLEITENAILLDPARAMGVVAQLADLGVKISIDDFGTGYSSLAYLKNLAVHELKIDKSFVLGMVESGCDRTIVNSVISLAHDLGLSVVAEGIETMQTLKLLTEFGCDVGQGFYCGRPIFGRDFGDCLDFSKSATRKAARPARRQSYTAVASSPASVPARAVAQKA